MGLADEYRLQAPWRDWTGAFGALPAVRGQRVLDLGCALGDQAAELVRRGARVLGIDGNEDLLRVARTRGLTNAEFLCQDVRDLRLGDDRFDGLWSSFTAAYLVDLPHALHSWKRWLARGAWIALVEVDDLFAHEPVRDETRRILHAYAEDAVTAGRYDFRMGRRLRPSLEACGFTILAERSLSDAELAFSGGAAPDVLEAWRTRWERMPFLRAFAGIHFEPVRDDFLACLQREDHQALSRVQMCVAAVLPVHAELIEPRVNLSKGGRVDGVDATCALGADACEAVLAQDTQMLRHGGLRDAELALDHGNDLARGVLSSREEF